MKDMKVLAQTLLLSAGMVLAETKHPGQAGNDNIELTAQLILDPSTISQTLGVDLEPGYVAVRVTATPKTGDLMRVGPSDFTLISRRNGERSDAISPAHMVSKSSLVVKRDTSPRDYGQIMNEPGFAGVAGLKQGKSTPEDAALLEALKSKMLPDGETKTSVSGLVYFSFEARKLKSKDIAVTYKGLGGRLTIEFN